MALSKDHVQTVWAIMEEHLDPASWVHLLSRLKKTTAYRNQSFRITIDRLYDAAEMALSDEHRAAMGLK